MFRKAIAAISTGGAAATHRCRTISRQQSTTASSAVNSMILRSLKDHYLEVSNMAPPPKVEVPAQFTILKGALDTNGPVLRKTYNHEEISVSVMRLANIVSGDVEDDADEVNQLFVHVEVAKPGQEDSLHFLCGLYPDALGIHSVAMRPKSEEGFVIVPDKYSGPLFENLDEATRDAFHNYIEERGINEGLFSFLQAWLYVKDHRNLMRWFRSLGNFVNERGAVKGADEAKAVPTAYEPKAA